MVKKMEKELLKILKEHMLVNLRMVNFVEKELLPIKVVRTKMKKVEIGKMESLMDMELEYGQKIMTKLIKENILVISEMINEMVMVLTGIAGVIILKVISIVVLNAIQHKKALCIVLMELQNMELGKLSQHIREHESRCIDMILTEKAEKKLI